MKKLLFSLFGLVALVFIFQSCEETLLDDPVSEDMELKSANVSQKTYIVVLEDTELNAELIKLKGYEKKQVAVKAKSQKILERAGITDGEIGFVYGTALKGFSVKIPPGQLKKLQDDPLVKSITEDQIISLGNPVFKIKNDIVSGEYIPYGVTRVNGGFNYTGNNVAWIIDTGIDTDHPDLNVNESRGASFVDDNSSPEDDEGHGTHVAGTIAAKNTGNGLVGVAAGATVIPVKVLDADGSGAYSWIIAGVDFVAANGQPGDVANMSLGGPKYDLLNEAVINAASKGIKFALAAGNERADANTKSPASANHPNIYTVSACDINDIWARFSNYGNPPVDYSAPGVDITSTYIGGQYATASGTSMAAPHVAGILLLGDISGDGYVLRDRDKNPDPIAFYNEGITPTNNPPIADFSFTTNGLSAIFSDASTDSDGAVDSWSWDFGDGFTSAQQSPTHVYDASGTYPVKLTITDNDGSTDEITQNVSVSEDTGGEIILSAIITGNKVKKATLTWTGASGATVDIYKNNAFLSTVSNSGTFSENLGKITSGTFTYYIIDELGIKSNPAEASVN